MTTKPVVAKQGRAPKRFRPKRETSEQRIDRFIRNGEAYLRSEGEVPGERRASMRAQALPRNPEPNPRPG